MCVTHILSECQLRGLLVFWTFHLHFQQVITSVAFYILDNQSVLFPKRFTVKTPESHLARSHVARNLSHVARNFSNVTRKNKSQVARRNNYQKDQNFRLLIGNNVENFLSLKRSLFPITPWRFLKRRSFLTTKGNFVRFQQKMKHCSFGM